MKVLSLFDGISCGKVALERAGIQVEEYVAYEIDKSAIQISKKNYPEIVQRGDVTKADFTEFKGFDLVMGGSPCQGFSIAGKQLNFEDPRSKLFFEFKRAIDEVKPKYFLLENVKMKKEYENIISEYLGVEPIEINSSLVSAQNRKRLYWTNIPGVQRPEDRGIMLKDIVHENRMEDKVDLTLYKVPFDKTLKIIEKEVQLGKLAILGRTARQTVYIPFTGKQLHYVEKLAVAPQKWVSIFSDVSRRIAWIKGSGGRGSTMEKNSIR